MAAVVPLEAASLVKVGDPGGGYKTRQHKPRFFSSRRKTLEQQVNQQRSKENLQLLKDALYLLDRQSFETDPQSYAVLLKSCTDAEFLRAGQFIHEHISVNGYDHLTFLCNYLIQMYGKCGALEDARFLFDSMDQPNVFTWTMLMAVYIDCGCLEEAYKLFLQMRLKGAEPNEFTFSTVLGACTSYGGLAKGRHIHACAILYGFDSDTVVGTALVNMYGKCRSAKDAGVVFYKLQQYDVVAWNAMIALLVEHREGKAALDLFKQMVHDELELDKVTFASILGACVDQDFLEQGQMIHANVVGVGYVSELIVTNALIAMYGKCGSPCSASVVFNNSQSRDVVSWTALIVAYVQHPKEALQLFKDMLLSGFTPNEFTYASVLTACSSLRSLWKGRLAHHCIIEAGLEANIVVATALLGMYGKCINLEEAFWVFDHVHESDLVLWNAMIAIYTEHGLGKEALNSLRQMQQEGHSPDEITFTSVLSACGHAGLVDEGCGIYVAMIRKYNIMPSVEHCGCMVDLFGRATLLRESVDFIESMHLKPNIIVWEIFLNSCRLVSDKSGIDYATNIISKFREIADKSALSM